MIWVVVGIFLVFFVAGALFASRRRAARRVDRPLNVVLVGGTRGVGAAMAQTFLEHGDNVVVAGRSGVPESLKSERLFSTTCDVLDGGSLRALGKFAHKAVGVPDLWVHLAAVSHAARDTIDQIDDADLRNVVQTNVLGTLLSTKAALLCGARTIFLFDGAGTDGRTTPKFAAYGATKAGLVQFMKTINAELKQKGERPRVNLCSPGMVITDLLLRLPSKIEHAN